VMLGYSSSSIELEKNHPFGGCERLSEWVILLRRPGGYLPPSFQCRPAFAFMAPPNPLPGRAISERLSRNGFLQPPNVRGVRGRRPREETIF
jgi:hypothetical protein